MELMSSLPARPFATPAARWTALTHRDRNSDTHFVYGVLTTKIFCRPVCPARLARRANVTFFDKPAQALAAGFRPCRRCKPDTGPENVPFEVVDDMRMKRKEGVERAMKLMQTKGGSGLSLDEVAKVAGIGSKWHFLRVFKEVRGETPGAVMARLREGGTVEVSESNTVSPTAVSSTSSIDDNNRLSWIQSQTDCQCQPTLLEVVNTPTTLSEPLSALDTAWSTTDPTVMDQLYFDIFAPDFSPSEDFLASLVSYPLDPEDFDVDFATASVPSQSDLLEFHCDNRSNVKLSSIVNGNDFDLITSPPFGMEDWLVSSPQ